MKGRFYYHAERILTWARNDPGAIVVNIGTSIGFLGFCTSDQLQLRYCSMISGVAGMYYNLTRKPYPIMIPVYWSVAFFCANIYNVHKLLLDRSNVELNDEQENIYAHHFMSYGIRPRQFLNILNGGKIKSYPSNTILAGNAQDEKHLISNAKVYLLLNGTAHVIVDGEVVSIISSDEPLCFVGEMGLLDFQVNNKTTQSDNDRNNEKEEEESVNQQKTNGDNSNNYDIRLQNVLTSDGSEEVYVRVVGIQQKDDKHSISSVQDSVVAHPDTGVYTSNHIKEGTDSIHQQQPLQLQPQLSYPHHHSQDIKTDESIISELEEVENTRDDDESATAVVAESSSSSDSDSHTEHQAETNVIAATDIKVIEWDKKYLVDLLSKGDEVSNKLTSILFATMRIKLKKVTIDANKKTYRALLRACISSGQITTLEKKALSLYRKEHHIDSDDHISILQELGWSEEDYVHGTKQDTDVFHLDNITRFLQRWIEQTYHQATTTSTTSTTTIINDTTPVSAATTSTVDGGTVHTSNNSSSDISVTIDTKVS